MIVIDASALFEVLIKTPHSAAIADRIFAGHATIHAPHIIDLEIANTLRRYVLRKELSRRDADQAVEDFASIPLRRHAHRPLIPRIWELRNNLTPYDAAYVVLAEMLGAPLITRDSAMTGLRGHHAQVELF